MVAACDECVRQSGRLATINYERSEAKLPMLRNKLLVECRFNNFQGHLVSCSANSYTKSLKLCKD